ncbi:gp1.6 [Escherichia phage EcoDS1]|uniref:Gp1.6 n=1 Tax=Escherichia phage EcoDS1 TaxID=532075 RepID=B3VCT7_9CAUD|nr:gp1.6 [Escherichia phage EcoDS1]ACF15792.1 gp1.6 [Escherichia phage EcoDS1]
MSKNLMFNRYSNTFHLSNNPLACIKRNEKLGYFGKAVKLSPTVYALITPGKAEEARQKKETSVPVVYTKWPRVRLFIEYMKEVF